MTEYPAQFSLKDLGLLDAPPEEAFDNLTALTTRVLGISVSLVSIIDTEQDRQFFKSQTGLPEPWAKRRQTPLSHSFCQYVRRTGRELVVSDARITDLVRDNLAIADLNVIAYLGAPIFDPAGTPIGALCAIDDKPRLWTDENRTMLSKLAACVSDQIKLRAAWREAEALRQRAEAETQAKSRFLAHMSHEIRTPLNGLIGIAQLLRQSATTPDDAELVASIENSGQQLLSILNDVLDLSKMIAGRLDLEQAPFHPGTLAECIEQMYAARASSAGVSLRVGVSQEAQTLRVGDANRLVQLLHNLVGNALKFTEAGSITVEFDAVPEGPLEISVMDTGIGMTEAELAVIFDEYVQAKASTARRFGGTGLGMPIVRKLVDAMGGTISIESTPGAGTAVRIALPLPLAVDPSL